MKGCFLVAFILLGMSPVLKTLTGTTSTDSIYAMAACMLLVNLFTHDYGAGRDHKLYACCLFFASVVSCLNIYFYECLLNLFYSA